MSRGWVRRRLGVRTRSALAAAAVVAVALTISTGAFLLLYRGSLLQRVDDVTTSRAQGVADQVAATRGRPRLPHDPGDPTAVLVLDPSGRVRDPRAAEEVADWPAIVTRVPAGRTVRIDRPVPGDSDQSVHLVAIGVATPAGTYRVIAVRSLRPVTESVRDATGLLLTVNIVLLVIVASATWWFVGRSLRPVERIRSRVAGITARDLSARVPVPATHDEVSRLAVTMNPMLDRLESAVTAQRRFVADASHELRSPLATATTALDLMAGDELPTPDRPELTLARQETARLGLIIDDLLLLARADERGLRRAGDDVDLDDIVVDERARLAARGTPAVTARIGPARVRGDRGQLARAVRNLTDNAARHAAGRVALSVGVAAGRAVVEVSDDGPGIAAADRERVFDRFVRLDASRDRGTGGSGLGLAIVREIVTAHGGEVTLDDAPGGGARFRLLLPLAP